MTVTGGKIENLMQMTMSGIVSMATVALTPLALQASFELFVVARVVTVGMDGER